MVCLFCRELEKGCGKDTFYDYCGEIKCGKKYGEYGIILCPKCKETLHQTKEILKLIKKCKSIECYDKFWIDEEELKSKEEKNER